MPIQMPNDREIEFMDDHERQNVIRADARFRAAMNAAIASGAERLPSERQAQEHHRPR
jgi:hypothetical protein